MVNAIYLAVGEANHLSRAWANGPAPGWATHETARKP